MRTTNTLSVLFWLNSKKLTNGMGLIYARVTVNRQRVLISLKRKIPLDLWDTKLRRAKGNSSEAKNINQYLDQVRSNIFLSYQDLKFNGGTKKFKIKDYDPVEEFQHIFGIINGTGEKPQKIVLSFTPTQGRYIKSLPLHHSQKELLSNEKELRFEYLLVPTHDFKMEIMSYGDQVKVLEPKSLRVDIVSK